MFELLIVFGNEFFGANNASPQRVQVDIGQTIHQGFTFINDNALETIPYLFFIEISVICFVKPT